MSTELFGQSTWFQPVARTGHEQEALRRQIEATDVQIDRLVYELYGLTDDEIRLVEEAGP